MPKLPTNVLRQLQAVLIPGLEMAMQALVREANQIRVATGQGPDYAITLLGNRLGEDQDGDDRPVLTVMDSLGRRKTQKAFSPEARANIAAAQKARWAKAKAESRRGISNFPHTSGEDIKTWARRHDGVFEIAAWKAKHPKTHLRAIGLLVRQGFLKPVEKGIYKLIE